MDYLDKGNSFMSIYQDTENYQSLCSEDQKFFKRLFVLLLVFGDLTMSNKEIGERLKEEKAIPVSTVEKRISRLKKTKLIIGWEERKRTGGRWRTIKRHLQLAPELFSFVAIKDQEKRIFTARVQAAGNDIDSQLEPYKASKAIEREPAEPPPQVGYKVEVSFT